MQFRQLFTSFFISRYMVTAILIQGFKAIWANLQKQRMSEHTVNALGESLTVETSGSFHVVSGYGW
jgi:hypothetical protein